MARAAALMSARPEMCRPDSTSASCRLGGDDLGQREQLPAQSAHGIRCDQIRVGGGYHHGVHDDVFRLVKAETLGDRLNERGRGHHADLDGAGADVGEDGVYLLGQKLGLTSKMPDTPVVFWAAGR